MRPNDKKTLKCKVVICMKRYWLLWKKYDCSTRSLINESFKVVNDSANRRQSADQDDYNMFKLTHSESGLDMGWLTSFVFLLIKREDEPDHRCSWILGRTPL